MASCEDSESRVSHLEALLVEHQETVADQAKTIEHLSEDNKLLKRCLFGSRRERFEDPAQTFLFNVKPLDSEPQQDEPVEPLPRSKEAHEQGPATACLSGLLATRREADTH